MSELPTDAIDKVINYNCTDPDCGYPNHMKAKDQLQALLDEIERLRIDRDKWMQIAEDLHLTYLDKEYSQVELCASDIVKAILNEGSHPLHHRKVMARHRKEWSVLWKAIDELVKSQSKETNNEYRTNNN